MLRLILLLLCLLLPTWLHADNVGPVYSITEPDLLKTILAKIQEKQRTGELSRLQEEAKQRSIHSIENPKPVPGLSKTAKARTFYYDPSITVTRDVIDPTSGKLLVPASTRVNPLDYVSLSKKLFFFDARDKDQVKEAEDLIRRLGGRVKPILTGGSYMGLMRQWKRKVYFDQQGTLVKKFGIEHVPAIVSQEGKMLRIDEVQL
jgi:conjugal transfer pilus assembly protein TraW